MFIKGLSFMQLAFIILNELLPLELTPPGVLFKAYLHLATAPQLSPAPCRLRHCDSAGTSAALGSPVCERFSNLPMPTVCLFQTVPGVVQNSVAFPSNFLLISSTSLDMVTMRWTCWASAQSCMSSTLCL